MWLYSDYYEHSGPTSSSYTLLYILMEEIDVLWIVQ